MNTSQSDTLQVNTMQLKTLLADLRLEYENMTVNDNGNTDLLYRLHEINNLSMVITYLEKTAAAKQRWRL